MAKGGLSRDLMAYGSITFDARREAKQTRSPVRKTAAVREMRNVLSGVTPEGLSFKYELLALFVKNQLGVSFAMPVLAVIMAASTLLWQPWVTGALWLSTIFICQGIMLTLCRLFNKADPETANVSEWGRKLAAAEFLHSTNWAMLLYLVWDGASPEQQLYLSAMLMVVVSIRMAIASNYLAVVYAGTLPITLALALRCAIEAEPLYAAMSSIAIAAQIYFLQLARKINQTARDMLEFRAQKDTLITELDQARLNSDQARRRAEDANIAKSKFLATMSHELRTPLNAILGFSEIMNQEMLGPHSVPIYKEYSSDIHRSGKHLLTLINEILDLSRIEAGRYELMEEPVALESVGHDCHGLLKVRAKERGVQIIEAFEPGLPRIYADERAVRQIWFNLLSNAIKFTPAGGTATLRVQRNADGGIDMGVRDTGPGIPEHEIGAVLSSFGQGSLAQYNAEHGAGLGLPIIQGLVKLHGGAFNLHSKPRQGTDAVVSFPAARMIEDTGPLDLTPQTAVA